jgi:hypothetical protein
MARRGIRVFTLLLLLHPLSRPGSAQSVMGEVIDEAGVAVPSVTVGLIDEDGRLVAHARSDSAGRFHVKAPMPGRYRVHVAGVGYRSLSGGPYDLVRDVALETVVVVHPVPIPLEPVDVEVDGRVPRLVSNGFYERAAHGRGSFFEGDAVRRSGSASIAEFLARLPRVRADSRGANVFGSASVRNPALYFEGSGAPCVPALWVDGSLVRPGGTLADPLRPDDWAGKGDLAGLEFYTGPAGVPIEFGHSAACAVLVVWTRGS